MIYLDNAATTKPSASALEKAQIFNTENYFNPSALYAGGLRCAREIKLAKENILKNLHAVNSEVIFTSCGSESDNLAIKGIMHASKRKGNSRVGRFFERLGNTRSSNCNNTV